MSSIMLCFTLLSFCFSSLCLGDVKDPRAGTSYIDKETLSEMERRRKEPKISQEFSRGRFLIYDCKQRSFVCVNEPSYLLCREKRNLGYRAKRLALPCAPLKEFKEQVECFNKQYSLIHSQSEKSYCQNSKNAKY